MNSRSTTKSFQQMLDEKIWWKHRYNALKGDFETADLEMIGTKGTNASRTRRRYLISATLITILILVAGTYVTRIFLHDHLSTIDQCGTTASEARARGCFFEMTLSLWVPEACYDRDLEQEYLSDPDLAYYRDIDFTERVPIEEVQRGEVYAWFVPWEHHIRHCAFALKKFHRAVASGGPIDGYLLNYNHTLHCIDMMVEPPGDLVGLPQRDVRMFPYCGRKGGWNVDKYRRFQWTD